MRTPQTASARRRSAVLMLGLGLLLSLSACKDKLEDLPDIDPLDDPWVNEIDNLEADEPAAAEPGAVAVAPDPTAVAAVGAPPEDEAAAPEVAEGEPAAADEGSAEAAKVIAAKAPTPKSGSDAGAGQPAAPAGQTPEAEQPGEPVPEAAAEQPGEPAPEVAPAPAPEPAKPAAPPPITMADFDGTWTYSGGSAGRAALDEAIEAAAMQVAAIVRGIARRRLRKTQVIETPITMTVTGDKVHMDWKMSGNAMTVVIDGPTSTMKYSGDKYKVRVRKKNGKMIHVFQAPDATKTIVYVLSSDRKRMTVHHKLIADQLDTPMTYKVNYTRN